MSETTMSTRDLTKAFQFLRARHLRKDSRYAHKHDTKCRTDDSDFDVEDVEDEGLVDEGLVDESLAGESLADEHARHQWMDYRHDAEQNLHKLKKEIKQLTHTHRHALEDLDQGKYQAKTEQQAKKITELLHQTNKFVQRIYQDQLSDPQEKSIRKNAQVSSIACCITKKKQKTPRNYLLTRTCMLA